MEVLINLSLNQRNLYIWASSLRLLSTRVVTLEAEILQFSTGALDKYRRRVHRLKHKLRKLTKKNLVISATQVDAQSEGNL